MPASVHTYRFTVEDFHRMVPAGILKEDDRVELIDGELIAMTPIGPGHCACVTNLTELLVPRTTGRARVSVQNAVRLSLHSEMYPDVALLRLGSYATRHPDPGDVLLIIEVADTTLDHDRSVKLPRYAEAGIPEVWIVNLPDAAIEVSRDPAPTGYRSTTLVRRGDRLQPAALPTIDLAVNDILPT
jgi:Uma2 family endonuclease